MIPPLLQLIIDRIRYRREPVSVVRSIDQLEDVASCTLQQGDMIETRYHVDRNGRRDHVEVYKLVPRIRRLSPR